MRDLLERLLADPESDGWLPPAPFTALVVNVRETHGDLPGAAELAHRGAEAYPEDYTLLLEELVLRSRTEDEGAVLEEMSHRLDRAGDAAPAMRLHLAERYSGRAQWAQALAQLGSDPDAFPPDKRDDWYHDEVTALAGAGRVQDMSAAFDSWRRRGGDPYELLALHALLLSSRELNDPDHPTVEMLEQVVADKDHLQGNPLLKASFARLAGTLAVAGEHQAALRYYDEGVQEFGDLYPLTRDELLRSATFEALGEQGLEKLRGRLRFRVAEHRPGDALWISPDADQPEDEGYERHAVPVAGAVEVSRGVGTWPHHWVLRDGDDRVAGSGTIWATPGQTVDVDVDRREPEVPEPAFDGRRRPADGRPRVFQVILDCGDWRFVQYGRARREMPFFDSAIERGQRHGPRERARLHRGRDGQAAPSDEARRALVRGAALSARRRDPGSELRRREPVRRPLVGGPAAGESVRDPGRLRSRDGQHVALLRRHAARPPGGDGGARGPPGDDRRLSGVAQVDAGRARDGRRDRRDAEAACSRRWRPTSTPW